MKRGAGRLGSGLALVVWMSGCGPDAPPPVPVLNELTEVQLANRVERGRLLFTANDCAACHRLDGGPLTGPPLNAVFGETVTLTDGSTRVRDFAYFRTAILDPEAEVVQGYTSGMGGYSALGYDDADAIALYLRSLTLDTEDVPQPAADAGPVPDES